MNSKHCLHNRLITTTFGFLIVSLFSIAQTLQADSVKVLNDLNYRNVKILEIAKGTLTYLSAAGIELKKPLSEIESIEFDSVPELGAAERDRLRKRLNQAVRKYRTARGKIGSTPKGLAHWVDYQLSRCYDMMGDGNQAIRTYLQLQQNRADPFFLELLPERSIDNITKEQQADYKRKIATLVKRTRNAAAKKRLNSLKQMIESVTFTETAVRTGGGNTKNTPEPTHGLPARAKSKVFFPRAMDVHERDEITRLLRAGDLKSVLEKTTAKLKQSEIDFPSMRILQMGLAQKNLAMQKSGKDKDEALKDCAITLLHIPTYYGSNSNWVGAAYAELGMIHMELKSPELAKKLLNDAQAFVNPNTEPELFELIVKSREKLGR